MQYCWIIIIGCSVEDLGSDINRKSSCNHNASVPAGVGHTTVSCNNYDR
jgi:hypothetical protein